MKKKFTKWTIQKVFYLTNQYWTDKAVAQNLGISLADVKGILSGKYKEQSQ